MYFVRMAAKYICHHITKIHVCHVSPQCTSEHQAHYLVHQLDSKTKIEWLAYQTPLPASLPASSCPRCRHCASVVAELALEGPAGTALAFAGIALAFCPHCAGIIASIMLLSLLPALRRHCCPWHVGIFALIAGPLWWRSPFHRHCRLWRPCRIRCHLRPFSVFCRLMPSRQCMCLLPQRRCWSVSWQLLLSQS
jgi:hypothetical protein